MAVQTVNHNWSVRHLRLNYGDRFEPHGHWADHVLTCITGPMAVDLDYPSGWELHSLDQGDFLIIPRDIVHSVKPLSERGCQWTCTFNYHDAIAQGALSEEWDKDKGE